MSEKKVRFSLLEKYYQQYLNDEISANFIHSVCQHYSLATLERVYFTSDRTGRRAAILALGFLGDFSHNETMGRAMSDSDRGVRMLADHGIREIWPRQGLPVEQEGVKQLYRLNDLDFFEEAIEKSTMLIRNNPLLAEAWNQRAIAYCALGEFENAIEDCKETLNCNRFHFPAAMGLGHCCLQLEDPQSALEGFRLALQINPELDGVRKHVRYLERTLDEN
jgi:tetratricopeptide (TPR) repeat protein